ncbi:hypothetical protein [Streptomyces sp. 147326]|uniref:hypothetical protein n=1 Tax=Streptomyces sp. 147326 TaxID=3074379 RepID=UPI0038577B2C
MATPADMPKRTTPPPRDPNIRLRLVELLSSVLDEVAQDGPLPQGDPHPAMEFLPELISSIAAYSTITFAVQQAKTATTRRITENGMGA